VGDKETRVVIINKDLNKSVRIFDDPLDLAKKFAREIVGMIAESANRELPFSIALSGGSTPELLYSVLGDQFPDSVKWDNVCFFWGDERCVPPDDPDSNYGMTRNALLGKINIPAANILRVRGEDDPANEAIRYSQVITEHTGRRNGLPIFDLIILGLGEDGHTASIFPENMAFLNSEKICEVAFHPASLQKRITITGRVINNGVKIVFLVTGNKKAGIVEKIINKNSSSLNFPASWIVPAGGELIWMIDKEAASCL
jgi:6-phosphogluconolactonase